MPNEPTTLLALAGDDWADVLAAAPREMFVPDVVWTVRGGLLDRESDPDAWFAAVASSDTPVVTQVDDGNVELTAENVVRHVHRISSSCSAPSQVFGFLRLLDPYPGDRVLEIGTGTGWTAALTGLLPGVIVGGIGPDSDRISLWDPTTGSYALAIDNGDDAETVGPRHLWTELETAYLAWVKHGEPDLHRLGLHIDSTGQETWLDTPHNRLTQERNHG